MQDWFVYYKLDRAALPELEPRIRALLQSVHQATGVHTRLMQRADGNGATTLLEIYERVAQPDAFGRALTEAVARANLPPALVAQRRTERFEER